MRLTSSYAVFQADPGEQDLAKARFHGREGRIAAAEREYRAVLEKHPDLTIGWMELFELLRHDGRVEEALHAAERAEAHFGAEAAVPLALKGAALSELGRVREAVRALEGALERDGNLALAWHELAYAAYRVGEFSRALLALDRAFALEPHTDTLMLRGRILREAGQYEAALVALEGAWQSAEHEPQRRDAELEMATARRATTLSGKRPRQFTPRERLFVDLGAVVLDAAPQNGPLPLARCLAAIAPLATAAGWHPAAVAPLTADDQPIADFVAAGLGAASVSLRALDPTDRPLLVGAFVGGGEEWLKQRERLARWRAGVTFALVQAPKLAEAADVVGVIGAHDARAVHSVLADAITAAATLEPPDLAEPTALLMSAEAPWRRRITGEGEAGR